MRTSHVLMLCAATLLTGAMLGQLTLVQAQTAPKPFTECSAALTWVYSASAISEAGNPSKTVRIPRGWTPIGGGARGTEGIVIMCR